jgi:hypothetical protein
VSWLVVRFEQLVGLSLPLFGLGQPRGAVIAAGKTVEPILDG